MIGTDVIDLSILLFHRRRSWWSSIDRRDRSAFASLWIKVWESCIESSPSESHFMQEMDFLEFWSMGVALVFCHDMPIKRRCSVEKLKKSRLRRFGLTFACSVLTWEMDDLAPGNLAWFVFNVIRSWFAFFPESGPWWIVFFVYFLLFGLSSYQVIYRSVLPDLRASFYVYPVNIQLQFSIMFPWNYDLWRGSNEFFFE